MPARKTPRAHRGPERAAAGQPPARSVEALRALALRVGQGDALIGKGGKAHGVLARLVERPEEVALRSITELADALGVSPSTLTRLATRLGYSGFVDFQKVFRNALALQQRHFYGAQPADASAARQPAEIAAMLQLARDAIANTEGFLAQLSAQDLRHAAHLLATAPHVRVHGLRQFGALAGFLVYGLALLRSGAALLDPQGLGVAEGLAQLQAGDALVLASVAPHTRSVVETAAVAAAAGMRVIAITDHRASPLARFAKHSFFVPHGSSFFSHSIGACVIFCEGLLNLVAADLGQKAWLALERRERFIAELKIE